MKSSTEFASWRAFSTFEKEVSKQRRYIRTEEAEHFLAAVKSTTRTRRAKISKGRGFWRAQAGYRWRYLEEIDDEIPAAFAPERMKPLSDRAMEGRANPKGIPMLYLGSNKDAAMSEVRPWIGSMISLGHFETNRDLEIVDCTKFTTDQRFYMFEQPPQEEWDDIVWSDINRAFTKPVTRGDDTGDYVATQILVELFRDQGFDGIAYRSAFGDKSTNFAFFDLDCADLTSCQLHEVSSVKMNFETEATPIG